MMRPLGSSMVGNQHNGAWAMWTKDYSDRRYGLNVLRSQKTMTNLRSEAEQFIASRRRYHDQTSIGFRSPSEWVLKSANTIP